MRKRLTIGEIFRRVQEAKAEIALINMLLQDLPGCLESRSSYDRELGPLPPEVLDRFIGRIKGLAEARQAEIDLLCGCVAPKQQSESRLSEGGGAGRRVRRSRPALPLRAASEKTR